MLGHERGGSFTLNQEQPLKGLKDSNFDSFFNDVIVSCKPWDSGVQDVIAGSYNFVCAHGSRDVRCGVCGPVLIDKLNEEIQLKGFKDQMEKLWLNCSAYLIFNYMYGYVTPNDVPALLDQHIAKGEVIQKLWRGQMGPPIAEVKGENDEKLANGKNINVESNNKNIVGCCQGVDGVSCGHLFLGYV
ncbi:sucrase/ferredoxin family protein [Medicago truncatula]|uniref:Sucrase/ferredoxin family protein n=1 Tax=Medicago truncatula TaxID=3880 RepID=A0A072U6L2_MEDTR|nr:sucrase/ferredoxin family protein [Medicago truncatula]